MNLLQGIGNDINPSIQLEIYYLSRNVDYKLPILDIKVSLQQVGDRKMIIYEHYRKEVATKATVLARSAVPNTLKRTILTQAILRVMRHCSPCLPIDGRIEHINEIMKRIQFSGFPQEFRYDVYNSASMAYNKLKEDEECGRRPISRPKAWRRTERKIDRENKRKEWYTKGGNESVIFVPFTPGSTLRKSYEEEIRRCKFKIKVVERSGVKIKDILHQSIPFKGKRCSHNDCFKCTSDGKGACDKHNV